MNRRDLLGVAAAAAAGAALPVSLMGEKVDRKAPDVPAVLKARTQEMLDAIAAGRAEVWDRYLHPHFSLTSEGGEVQERAKVLQDLKPLPSGISGVIRAIDFRCRLEGAVAIATYVSDEDETYHGQLLHCQYRTTDTWVETPSGWLLLASQVLALRYDPPAVDLAPSLAGEYVGTYRLTPAIAYEIRRKDGGLEGARTGRPPEILRAEAPDVLFVPGSPRYRYVVLRDGNGRVRGFAQRREAWDLVWSRSS